MRNIALAAILLAGVAGAAEPVKLIVHADDFGMCHSVNRATAALLDAGQVSSASIMMPCPWVGEAAEYARKHPEKDIGLHLTLTSEWRHYRWGPVASRERVPGLLDAEGNLWRSVQEVAQRASAGEVETELRAQIELARRLGIRFTHFDTHMGTLYARPDYFQVFEKLGREFGVPILRLKPSAEAQAQAPKAMVEYLLANEARYQGEGVFRLDRLIPDPTRGTRTVEERKAAYHKMLRELRPGVHQLIVHLGVLDPELEGITGSARNRDGDRQVFSDPATVSLLKELGIQLVGWQEVTAGPGRGRD